MLFCVACTTTLDPTLDVASGGAGHGASGASGAEMVPAAGAADAEPEITALPLGECSVLNTDHEYRACQRPRSFAEAVVDCATGGAVLIKVDTPAETELLKTVPTADKQAGWLGASRDDHFDWTWLDGTPFWHGDQNGTPEPGAYSNWLSGEPDNGSITVRDDERCGTFDQGSANWVDRYCNLIMPYVCELPVGATVAPGM